MAVSPIMSEAFPDQQVAGQHQHGHDQPLESLRVDVIDQPASEPVARRYKCQRSPVGGQQRRVDQLGQKEIWQLEKVHDGEEDYGGGHERPRRKSLKHFLSAEGRARPHCPTMRPSPPRRQSPRHAKVAADSAMA